MNFGEYNGKSIFTFHCDRYCRYQKIDKLWTDIKLKFGLVTHYRRVGGRSLTASYPVNVNYMYIF